jgi:tRNA guanosine-2'-O-methyltransferase
VGTITDDLDYWGIILHGLRCGDAERRKMCLNILKITVGADSDAVSNGLRKQYIRYATVFETIVLGRYINQVMECRNDLDFFANQEELDPRWVFTLLGAALDSQMQDSNRKFIGNWVMSANLKPGSQLVAFFEKDFLPWATQGQHFVATLKNENGHISCRHGQQLADFIKRLRRNSQDPKQITSIVVDAILRKRNSMFAYCTVYLLEGLEDSLDRQQTLDLARLRGLPEVARDYVALKTGGTPASEPDARTASVRHIRERKALDKIDSFESSLESLDDIWTDVEYLEFPKKLLMVLPAVILGPNTIAKAVNNAKLAGSISEKVETLQRVATTKTFLFPPLMMELRKAAKVIPEAYNVLDIPKLIVQIAEQLPGLTIDLMLEEAVIPLTPYSYEQYFGERLSYGFAAYIDLVSRLKEHQSKLKSVIDLILHPWKSQKIPPPIVTPWKNALQLQVLLLCFEQYKSHSTDEIYRILEDLFTVLAIEPLPSYRYLLEATVVRFIMLHKLRDTLIERLKTKDHHSNPKHLASLMKIGAILACTPDTTEQFAADLAIAFVSLAASSKVLIRHEAQWQVPVLVDHAKAQGWTSITTNPALSALDEYIRSLERFHDPPTVRQMSRFDPATDLTLTNLVEGRWFELDSTEQPLTSHNDFVKLYAQHSLRDAAPTCIPLGQPIARPLPETIKVHDEQPLTAPPGPKTLTDVTTALQTKGTAYLARALSTTPTSRRYPDLVVVASLVANPHNLGGLSRVSEVFGANALTLQNQNVLSNKEFLSVSVSSHLHFPIFQLSAPGMVAWLRERKRGGYTVVGIEQTDRSVMLGTKEARLPEKCCLVVGSEREGIPADVLVECELLVEIEQRGVTRSLNVQTAVGIVLFEYGRQHGGPK